MMLFVAIKELLCGMEVFLKGSRPEYEFVGTDSSFLIRFQKSKRGRIAVQCGAKVIGEVEAVELCGVLLSSVEEFVARPGSKLSEYDPVREDLFFSVQRLKNLLLAK
jgi:hypothetical protein